jgi:hypothetical protein
VVINSVILPPELKSSAAKLINQLELKLSCDVIKIWEFLVFGSVRIYLIMPTLTLASPPATAVITLLAFAMQSAAAAVMKQPATSAMSSPNPTAPTIGVLKA